ncbi:MAG: branched-chain amino acid ABC transporter permease [Chloroflexi bacterium]|nr:branched-chain amino acid ABC transporter permease [Chloroflexota bacterium]
MTVLLQLILSGIMVGSIYSLVALGFVLIYKSSGIINVAQGQMLMIGGFVSWTFLSGIQLPDSLATIFGSKYFPIPIAIALSVLVAILMGLIIERLLLRPMIGQPILAVVMMTIALAAFMDGMTTLLWGAGARNFPEFIPRTPIRLGELILSPQHLFAFLLAILLLAGFTLFFQRSHTGLQMRAAAEDHRVAQSLGVNVTRVFAMAWIISAVVSTLGGILLGSINGINLSLSFLGLKVLPVVLLGGLESIPGAIIAGPIIGILENLGVAYLDPLVGGGIKEVAPFFILLVVLLFKPYGLFGLQRIERV